MAKLSPIIKYVPLNSTGLLMHLNFLTFPLKKEKKKRCNLTEQQVNKNHIFYNTSHHNCRLKYHQRTTKLPKQKKKFQ